jgi:ABC-2 type transport system permease protein
MKKYIRIYRAYLRFSFNRFLSYRFDAVVNTIFSTGIWIFFTIFSMFVLTRRTGGIVGLSADELILLSCIYNIFVGVFGAVFMSNFNDFSDLVNLGKLDTFLLKPVDSQWSVSLSIFYFASLLRLVIGIILTVLFVTISHIHIQSIDILIFICLFFVAQILLYACLFTINTILIWVPRLDNITDIFYQLRSLGRYPAEAFSHVSELLFVLLSPFIIVLATPTKALLHRVTFFDISYLLVATVVMMIVARMFWIYALKNYTSASS